MWKYNGKEKPSFAIEPEDGQESVWDYPRPPKIENDSREIIIKWEGIELVRTTKAIRICETASPPTFYIPENDIKMEYLISAAGSSFCEWKGMATYWTVKVNQKELSKIGWSYENPNSAFDSIKDHIAFYAKPLFCTIDNEEVLPQDKRGFYGGWVTKEIVGPWKGGDDVRANGL
jgi:uncharacterized protein (DUF427 family)